MSPTLKAPCNAAAPQKAFTLLELVAMLAVLAILAGITTHAIFTRVREARRTDEQAELDRIASLWPAALRQSRALPSAEQWTEWLATYASMPIQRLALNASGLRRQVLFDPAMRLGRPAAAPPYVQGPTGSLAPVQPRLILASGLIESLPNLQTLNFEALWTNAPGRWPDGWPPTGAGEPDDLILARVDFRHQFRRLILQNTDPEASAIGRIQEESLTLAPGDSVEGWYLEGTWLELDSGSKPAPSLQTSLQLLEDTSFVFERGRWTHAPAEGPATAEGLGALADRFLAASTPAPTPRAAADQQAVVDEWVHFLNGYAQWSLRGFPTTPPGDPFPDPSHRTVQEARARLMAALQHLQSP